MYSFVFTNFAACIEKDSFVSLDDLENISEETNLEEEITHLFNEKGIFIFRVLKKQNQSGSKYTQIKTCTVILSNFRRFQTVPLTVGNHQFTFLIG